MAGYLFSLDSEESLVSCMENGIYSTVLSEPTSGIWRSHQEGTFADFASMKEGDNIYFFIKRKVYGIGKLKNIDNSDCKFLNYPKSNEPTSFKYTEVRDELLFDFGKLSINNRFICTFEPDPLFFSEGVDMDDVLLSKPESFRMLRVFWKLSFIKFDDDENQAFRDILLRRNKEVLETMIPSGFIPSDYASVHKGIEDKISNGDYRLTATPLLTSCLDGDRIRHEMAIEAALISQLTQEQVNTIAVFGKWDYISHQVVASPFKPVDYMDKMDVYGYSYIIGQTPTKSNFLIIEIKKDEANEIDLLQLMKYVDWVKEEYAYGDYSRISAFLVAYDFTVECQTKLSSLVERNYIQGVRPSVPKKWQNTKLISYSYNPGLEIVDFTMVKDGDNT